MFAVYAPSPHPPPPPPCAQDELFVVVLPRANMNCDGVMLRLVVRDAPATLGG